MLTYDWDPGGDVVVFNSIVWGGSVQIGFIQGGTTVLAYCDVEGGYEGDTDIDEDPLFVDPVSPNLRLLAGSPCIDAGLDELVPVDIQFDLDGGARLVGGDPDSDKPPFVNIGAYATSATCPGPPGPYS